MRAPCNVLVLPYIINENEPFFCIFKRQDMQIWQFVAGGGENNETPLEAAQRELYEEIQMNSLKVYKLDATTTVPVEYFKDFKDRWKEGLFVIPVYSFAAEVDNNIVKVSSEHVVSKWLNYEEAIDLLHFDIDKTALWELNKRLVVERRQNKNTKINN
ncbi:NUDIX hydrolase [Macrococcus sp. EM39E]|uniref:NUDIX hydrolase n=1 Tax=Macrococcus animalis TaxID=3395467 RepID=UPI0039BE4F40